MKLFLNRLQALAVTLAYGLAVIVLMLPAVQAQAAQAVAMGTDLTGEGHITRQGQPVVAEILSYLEAGDTIQTGNDSGLTLVYFAASKEYIFSGKAQLRIDDNQPVIIKGGKAKHRSLKLAGDSGLGQAVSQNYDQAAIIMRSARVKRKLILSSPKNTNVLSVRPEFRWHGLRQRASYHFTLTDDTGKIIVEDITQLNHYALDGDIRLRRDAHYTWRIDANQTSGKTYSRSAHSFTLPTVDYERVEAMRPKHGATLGERVLFAALLERLALKEEAKHLWRTLAVERPGAKVLMRKAGY